MKKVFATLIAYIVVAFLTYAWCYEANDWRPWERTTNASLAGMFWPIYWGSEGSLKIVRCWRGA